MTTLLVLYVWIFPVSHTEKCRNTIIHLLGCPRSYGPKFFYKSTIHISSPAKTASTWTPLFHSLHHNCPRVKRSLASEALVNAQPVATFTPNILCISFLFTFQVIGSLQFDACWSGEVYNRDLRLIDQLSSSVWKGKMAQKRFIIEIEKALEGMDGRPSRGPVYRSIFAKDGFPPPVEGMDSCWDIFRYNQLGLLIRWFDWLRLSFKVLCTTIICWLVWNGALGHVSEQDMSTSYAADISVRALS